MTRLLPLLALLAVVPAWADDTKSDEPKKLIGVPYGKHERQVLDFYQAKSDTPTPVVFHIHGGGWQGGDKKTNPQGFLAKGIPVAPITSRSVKTGVARRSSRRSRPRWRT